MYTTNNDNDCQIAAEIIQKAVENSLENNIKSVELGGKSSTSQIGEYITNYISNYDL